MVPTGRMQLWKLGETKATPASQLVDRLIDKFTKWDFWEESHEWTPTVVVIEQQVRGAHVNLALAFATYAYFKTRFQAAVVKFVHPSLKFKGFANYVTLQGQSLELAKSTTTLTYTKRKRLAVELAEVLLEQTGHPPLATLCTLLPGAKKDDIADAFLQSFCA